MPAADVAVTADLVRRLLAGQHPDLANQRVEFLANGWDNALFRVGDRLVARMPRRELGATIILHEQRWLPLLAPRLPLPIPYPERTGHSALGYPYSWSVVPFLPGTPAADADSLDPAAAASSSALSAPRYAGPPAWLHGEAAGGVADEGLWCRARGWALNLGIVWLAHSADNPQLQNVGRRTLGRIMSALS
jgi:Phosphotransferase enzyme family